MLWQASNDGITYKNMKTPSKYKLNLEDLDSNAFRSISTGNLTRNIIGKKWLNANLTFNYLTQQEAEEIVSVLNYYPMYLKIKSPIFGTNNIWEGQVYCSKLSLDMQSNADNTWTDLSFTLIQSKRKDAQR